MKKIIPICIEQKQSSGYTASVPLPFPIQEMFDIPENIVSKIVKAERLIGKLSGITTTLPDIHFFLKMFAYKDATYSAQIEGTKATMAQALEAKQHIHNESTDAEDIIFYIKALDYGRERLKDFPLSLRFLKETHEKLMSGGRQSHFSDPGNFRTSQNWIGGTNPNNASFVPVPAESMAKSLDDLEKFFHDESRPFPLVDIAFAHAQFETIHPFLDGNGRVGRLLITFLLMKKELLDLPVLFLSSFFKKHQQLYYERINGYHHGEVFPWLDFFLDGVIEIAQNSIHTSETINATKDEDFQKIQSLSKRESESGVNVLQYLFENPIVTTRNIMEATGFTRAGAQKVIDRFVGLEILSPHEKETNYDIKYSYTRYLHAFILD